MHAYCLMGNHYHAAIEIADTNLCKGVRQLNEVYTQYFNIKMSKPVIFQALN